MKIYSDEPLEITKVNEKGALAQFIVEPVSNFNNNERCVVVSKEVKGNLLAFGMPKLDNVEKILLVGGNLTTDEINSVRSKGTRRPLTEMIEDGPADFIFGIMEAARQIPNLSIYVDIEMEDIRLIELVFFIQKLKLLPIKVLYLNKFNEKLACEWY